MGPAASPPHEHEDFALRSALEEELSVAITESVGGAGVGELAQHLLDENNGRRYLVGLTTDAGNEYGDLVAVFFEEAMFNIVEVAIEEDGIDGLHNRRREQRMRQEGVEEWVRNKGQSYWTWLHPRYRWVFDV